MSIVRKSAQYFCKAFISIIDRQINYKCIIANNSSTCVITVFRLLKMEEKCLMFTLI